MGLNSRGGLAAVERVVRERINDAHMANGRDARRSRTTTYIDAGVRIGADTVIQPLTFLEGDTRIGERLRDRAVRAHRGHARSATAPTCQFAVVRGREDRPRRRRRSVRPPPARAPSGGPARRPGTFVEVKNSTVGEGSKVPHLSTWATPTIGRGRQHRGGHRDRELRRLRQAPHRDRRRCADRLGYDAGGAGPSGEGRRDGGGIGDHEGRAGGRARRRAGRAADREGLPQAQGRGAPARRRRGPYDGDHHQEADDAVHRDDPPGARPRDRRQPRHPREPKRSSAASPRARSTSGPRRASAAPTSSSCRRTTSRSTRPSWSSSS